MNDRILPAAVAITAGMLLAIVLLVPYVAVQYRRRGAIGPARAGLTLAALIYALALAAYVLLPLPPTGPDFCAHYGVGVQLRPLQFLSDIAREGVSGRPGCSPIPRRWARRSTSRCSSPSGACCAT